MQGLVLLTNSVAGHQDGAEGVGRQESYAHESERRKNGVKNLFIQGSAKVWSLESQRRVWRTIEKCRHC